jgi:ribosomal protein S18 acetylase RimI-like enzyme
MQTVIRPATAADAAVLADFNARLAWESEYKRLDPATLAAGVRAVLADPHKGFYTLAERGGAVVGQVLVTFEFSDWRNGWYWWIQSVYVRADARRSGVFRALFEHLHAAARADPAVIGLRLYVERANDRARATYRALGLTEEGYDLMGLYPLPGRVAAFGPGAGPSRPGE